MGFIYSKNNNSVLLDTVLINYEDDDIITKTLY